MNRVVALKPNEVFGTVQDHFIPITCDSVAEITVVPEECVGADQLTGNSCTVASFRKQNSTGKDCVVQIQVGDRVFSRKVVMQPGEDIAWTACLSVEFSDRAEINYIMDQNDKKRGLEETDTSYMPPRMEDGTLQPAVVVSEGTLVGEEVNTPIVTLAPDPQCEEGKVIMSQADVEGELNREAECEESLGTEKKDASVVAEVTGDVVGGSAEVEGLPELNVQSITSDEPRMKMAEATLTDTTLSTARALADKLSEGYYWVEGLIFRTRLDRLGDNREQLCLPAQYRGKCLTMAHEHFGHPGRNKMGDHIRKFFYWPSITADSIKHVKSDMVCLKKDKANPRPMLMQEREVVTVPSERVAVDIVGPFPTSKGGFRFLLTYLDMATRWPEAIPLRKTTTRILIDQLTLVFSRCGFPTTLIFDNGPQFVAKSFQKWLRDKGITHVRAFPYHPQGNGLVERMHRTLSNVITRCTESRGNWAQIVLMAMYFLRCMPSRTTGLSPFKAKHGWEPTTPLQIL